MAEYPKRESHFAHKFVRLLQKSCAALDIGQNACLLLVYIAHTEDASRYSGPVRFWNEQLMTTMAFKSPKQLVRARDAAVEAGWLAYERKGNRTVGRYWVTIPEEFKDIPDGVIEENHSTNRVESGTNTKRKAERIRNGSETESGKPSNPIPNPNPIESAFVAFWDAFAKKTDRKKALAAFTKALKSGVNADMITQKAGEYAKACQAAGGFQKHATTWLSGECWEDEDLPQPSGGGGRQAAEWSEAKRNELTDAINAKLKSGAYDYRGGRVVETATGLAVDTNTGKVIPKAAS